jgi:hypothetical protein
LRSTSQVDAEAVDGPDGVSGTHTDPEILGNAHDASGCPGEFNIITADGPHIIRVTCSGDSCPLTNALEIEPHIFAYAWTLLLTE